jgi:FixJ family two-component response regulator
MNLCINARNAIAEGGRPAIETSLATFDEKYCTAQPFARPGTCALLPKINGPEAYARVIAERADVPVIFATGYRPAIALLHKVQELGLAVLRKPYVPRNLARCVRQTLDRHPTKVHHT